jgi:ppGpp synthetase/RelA/SpoT-type nucleotidyltranferase
MIANMPLEPIRDIPGSLETQLIAERKFITMPIIEQFISRYNREFDFYQELSRIASTKIEDQLFKRGIKAIVSNRAKRPDRLLDKLRKRNEDKKYKSVDEIVDDIADLAGVRVSLYFPSERDVIDEIVTEIFEVKKKKIFPDAAHTPKYEKRFSGYWATHYRVNVKENSTNKRYTNALVEIQVASVLMHAWSEVEHDMVYKPFSGDLSKDEQAILDEINGLVLSGEIALERLHRAMSERTKAKKEISDKYELTNFIINNMSKDYLSKVKLGDTYALNNYINSTVKKISANKINDYIKHIDLDIKESITDQLLNMMIFDSYDAKSNNMKSYFKNLVSSDKKASAFEKFVRCWIILEKAHRHLGQKKTLSNKKTFIIDIPTLKDMGTLSSEEINELEQLRKIRNNILHGIEAPPEEYLRKSFQSLKKLTRKVVEVIDDEAIKTALRREVEELA